MASTQERELRLVGNVELRIASAKTDKDLKARLDTFLVPLLLKLASPHVAVRNEVIKVCKFIDTCITPTDFELPLKDLLTQFRDTPKDLVRLFDLRYIKLGLERIPVTRRRDYFPQVIQGLQTVYTVSPKQASGLFSLFVRLLLYIPLPSRASQEDLALREKLELSDQDTQFISTWLGKILLYQGPASDSQPCLSKEDIEFLSFSDETFWKVSGRPTGSINLTEAKIIAAKFLASGVFNDSERLIPAIIAAADPNTRISDTGIDMLKRCLTVSDLEGTDTVDSLFKLYSGTPPNVTPARPALKIRILNVLSKSAEAAKHKEAGIIVKDALDPATTGLEGSKLRTAAFAFVNWITRMSDGAIDTSPLLAETKVLIEGQGWPQVAATGSTSGDAAVLEARGKAYETIGMLVKTKTQDSESFAPELKPIRLTKWLFQSLLEDSADKEISLSIESAISNTLVAISASTLDVDDEDELLDILETFIRAKNAADASSRTAYPALRFVNQCFPFDNFRARHLNVLSLTIPGIRKELEEEAKGGLDPYIHSKSYRHGSVDVRPRLPKFHEMSDCLFNRYRDQLSGHSEAMTQAILFCSSLLFHQALDARGRAPVMDDRWSMNISSTLINNEESIVAAKAYLLSFATADLPQQKALEVLITATFDATVGPSLSPAISETLMTLIRFCPQDLLNVLQLRSSELKPVAMSTDHAIRKTAARAFGISASQESMATGKILELAGDLWSVVENRKGAVGAQAYRVQGALYCLGQWLARLHYRTKSATTGQPGSSTPDRSVKHVMFDSETLSTQLTKLSSTCYDILKHEKDKDLSEAAVFVMAELIRFDVPPSLTTFALDNENSDIMNELVATAKKGNINSVMLLGLLNFDCEQDASEGSAVSSLFDKMYSLHEEKKAELQFEVGSAMSYIAFTRDSKALVGWMDVPGYFPDSPPRDAAQIMVFDKVLAACKHTKPSLRQAGTIWLLCMLQYGGHTPFMKQRLAPCQLAFKALLGDSDSLNQESAASGLTLVYEYGDESIKGQLSKDLISSFTSSEPTTLAGQVSQETTLFAEGALPTGEGKSVSTYGDVMKLAREVGDDGLVYKFMNLAKNSSVWTSRAAFGRFGLSKVLSSASDDGFLAPNPKLYRALYRYRFDVNPNVQSAMKTIWDAVVKNPVQVVNDYFDDIIQDLLQQMMNGKEWRSRQASCAGLADLLQGRPLEKYEKYLNDIWKQTFKVTDDQKGSVREEAGKLLRVLTTIVKRTLQAGDSAVKNGTAMLKEVLPFLLGNNGINSNVEDHQKYALATVLDFVKVGSAVPLRPFLPDIMCILLEQLTALEPQGVNYVHLNADKYNITTQQLDDARVAAVGHHPVMEAVERCIDHLDEASMKELQPRLMETAKSGAVGLPSRVGVSRTLISLATRRNFLFRPYAGEFLTICRLKFTIDRNDSVSTSAANACGYLARISPDKDILKSVTWAQKQFFTSEDERRRVVAGELMQALGKYATDRFSSLSSSILPFIFVAKHDTFETSQELFKTTWEDNVSGPRVVLLHLKEILALCDEHLESPRWPLKHASAFSIAEAVAAAGKDMDEATARMLWPSVERALSGKTWDGKEKVLEGFVLLAKNSPLLQKDTAISTQMQKIIIREAKRNNTAFQEHSIAALGDFIPACSDVDWFDKTHEIVETLLDQLLETLNEKMDVDAKQSDAASSRVIALRTTANAMKTLLVAVNPTRRKGGELKADLEKALVLVKKAMTEKDRTINETIFDSLTSLFVKLHEADGTLHDANLVDYAGVLFGHGDFPEQTRLKAAEAVTSLAKLGKTRPELRDSLKEGIECSEKEDRSSAVKSAWATAAEQL